jgi:DNA-binding CsgD family transcriptional regulator
MQHRFRFFFEKVVLFTRGRFQSCAQIALIGVVMHVTARETAVLALIAQGFPDRAIARILAISPATARKHRENIQQKLNAGKAALLVWNYFRLHPGELKKSRRMR